MEQRPGLGLRPLLICFLLSLACYALVAAGVVVTQAFADEPAPYVAPADRALQPELPELASCPSAEVPALAEEEAEGEEVEPVPPELRELGHLRLEQQQACRAQTDRLDQLIERLWWVTSQTLALDHPEPALAEVNEWLHLAVEHGEATQEDLQVVRNALTDAGSGTLRSVLVGPEDEKALPVLGEFEAAAPEVDPELVASIDSGAEATKGALYFIAGLLVASVLGYGLYRVVDRNT